MNGWLRGAGWKVIAGDYRHAREDQAPTDAPKRSKRGITDSGEGIRAPHCSASINAHRQHRHTQ